ncbi:MAG: TniQ family protein [Fischerella sp. CENA71]|nr:TniQ family protein [Fischerella sp. CENA71]
MKQTDAFGEWVFRVEPYDGESFGHYLGRFRRANCLSRHSLAELVGVTGVMIGDWETPSRRRTPTAKQLATLSQLFGITTEQLTQMLPCDPLVLNLRTRLCPACYAQVPIHQKVWQQAGVHVCELHQQPLLTACPACGTDFRLPALWEHGCCEYCWLPFSQMKPAL